MCHPLTECTAICSPPQSHDRQALIPKMEGHQSDAEQSRQPTTSLLPRVLDWSSSMAPYGQCLTGQTTFPCLQAWIHNPATGAILWALSHLAHTDSTQTHRKSSASIPWLRFQKNESDSTSTVLPPQSLSAVLYLLNFLISSTKIQKRKVLGCQ
jgi:hypothetical protein